MAYVSQALKATLSPAIKAVFKKYGMKASISVRNHSTLVVNVKSGEIDFIANYNDCGKQKCHNGYTRVAVGYLQVNPYYINESFCGRALECLEELQAAMYVGNWDKSDSQGDYFNVGWYIDINLGQWDKHYVVS